MEMGIGFVLGIIFLESTLFIISQWKDEKLAFYVGAGLLYFPALGIIWVYVHIRNYLYNRKYLRCALYQEPCSYYDTIVIEKKDLDKFYWKGENEFYVEPIFYMRNGRRKYKKMVMDYRLNDKKMLSWHKEKNTHIYKRINLFLRKGNENAD